MFKKPVVGGGPPCPCCGKESADGGKICLQNARHNDLLSVMLGKASWPLIGKPVLLAASQVVG